MVSRPMHNIIQFSFFFIFYETFKVFFLLEETFHCLIIVIPITSIVSLLNEIVIHLMKIRLIRSIMNLLLLTFF